MDGSDFFAMLTIFFLFGLIGLALAIVWIFGEDPNTRDQEKRRDGSN
jgi:uncharacterized membrane protein YqjE